MHSLLVGSWAVYATANRGDQETRSETGEEDRLRSRLLKTEQPPPPNGTEPPPHHRRPTVVAAPPPPEGFQVLTAPVEIPTSFRTST
jgi:protein TonB